MKKLLVVVNNKQNNSGNISKLDDICNKINLYLNNYNRVILINWNETSNNSHEFNVIKNMDCYEDLEFHNTKNFTSSKLNDIIDGEYDQIEFCGSLIDVDILTISIIVKNIKVDSEIIIDSKSCIATNEDLYIKTLDIMKNLNMTII